MTALRFAVTDGWTITRRDLLHWRRAPSIAVITLLFPVLLLLMFSYLLGGGMAVPDGGDYREFLVPGMAAMVMLFGLETTFTSVATDATRGITDRFRSLPMSPSAVVLGRAGADLLQSLATIAVLIGAGLLVGWRWHNGLGPALGALAMLILLRIALLAVGIFLGLLAADPQAVVAMQILVWPFGFLSNVFTSPATMPGWLGTIADANPVSATVAAVRELCGNPGWPGTSWFAENATLLAVVWPLVLLAIFFPLAVRRYQRLNR
ncbi:ABC transporter permease [Labedaea rhizosphaerae]|uniref:Transport permease protein n=1 Tax=Labedaea rhizosphaerae TaxID=598644 RepID=A0A4R6RX97_LABRH|nr:ABC transporter permease [Labedaea rhizosphaerae]TDP91137.1 ABC transporter DrrB family efflux protein [Labedaea rhizosphaerae]